MDELPIYIQVQHELGIVLKEAAYRRIANVSSTDNGKIMMIVNGELKAVAFDPILMERP